MELHTHIGTYFAFSWERRDVTFMESQKTDQKQQNPTGPGAQEGVIIAVHVDCVPAGARHPGGLVDAFHSREGCGVSPTPYCGSAQSGELAWVPLGQGQGLLPVYRVAFLATPQAVALGLGCGGVTGLGSGLGVLKVCAPVPHSVRWASIFAHGHEPECVRRK